MEHERAVQNLAVECYLLGEMTAEEREDFEAHYFECTVCGEDLRAASQFIADAKDILAADRVQPITTRTVVDRPRPSRWLGWLQPQFAAAAIAILAVVAGVESFAIPSLERRLSDADTPRVVNPTYLKGQTRGGPETPRIVPGEPAVFTVDLPESSPSELQFVVESAQGHPVFRIAGRAPGHGDPVTLSIPKLDLPEGSYTLVVEPAEANGQNAPPLESYPFEIKR
ncbi:MAG TPA: zf-HC2 domain-containing protein [Bryobacteraceae bacterium]|jgi:hypothetical protein